MKIIRSTPRLKIIPATPREEALRVAHRIKSQTPRHTSISSPIPLDHLEMQKPRKKVNTSFIAEWGGTCGTCHREIEVGERARFNPEGLLVHHRHTKTDPGGKTCPQCWLIHPGTC
jgi:hypothetical protein